LEEDLQVKLSASKERYEGLFHDDPEYFNNQYMGKLLEIGYDTLIIHISYFTQIRARIFDVKPQGSTQWISLGIHTEHYPRREFIKSKVQKFIKILSDKKRFEMIELLGKKPHYVHELAAELELTPPTVSYHLNSLTDLNLASIERGNNRTYYFLKKDIVRELLDNAAEILLKGE
jgi:DNA-binding transcriptional ArsR family regulator